LARLRVLRILLERRLTQRNQFLGMAQRELVLAPLARKQRQVGEREREIVAALPPTGPALDPRPVDSQRLVVATLGIVQVPSDHKQRSQPLERVAVVALPLSQRLFALQEFEKRDRFPQ
jgi:hypothetical protein